MKWNWIWPISIWRRQKFSSSAPSLKFCMVCLPVLCNNKKRGSFSVIKTIIILYIFPYSVAVICRFSFFDSRFRYIFSKSSSFVASQRQVTSYTSLCPEKNWTEILKKHLHHFYYLNTMIMSYKERPIENSLPLKYVLLLLSEQLFGNTLLYVFLKMNTWDYF